MVPNIMVLLSNKAETDGKFDLSRKAVDIRHSGDYSLGTEISSFLAWRLHLLNC